MEQRSGTSLASSTASASALAARGVDAAIERRPGVPMEAEPHPDPGAHWITPQRQPTAPTHLRRKGLHALTPVLGTAQPPRGLSGRLRWLAYRVPEHRARHWVLLMAADRVDVLEHRAGEALGSSVRKRPVTAVGIALLAGYLAARARR